MENYLNMKDLGKACFESYAMYYYSGVDLYKDLYSSTKHLLPDEIAQIFASTATKEIQRIPPEDLIVDYTKAFWRAFQQVFQASGIEEISLAFIEGLTDRSFYSLSQVAETYKGIFDLDKDEIRSLVELRLRQMDDMFVNV